MVLLERLKIEVLGFELLIPYSSEQGKGCPTETTLDIRVKGEIVGNPNPVHLMGLIM